MSPDALYWIGIIERLGDMSDWPETRRTDQVLNGHLIAARRYAAEQLAQTLSDNPSDHLELVAEIESRMP